MWETLHPKGIGLIAMTFWKCGGAFLGGYEKCSGLAKSCLSFVQFFSKRESHAAQIGLELAM